MPLVSIIMPCYNADKYLEASVISILGQSMNSWELVIVNDGSTDSSEKIALELANTDARIRVVSKGNGGYVSARIFGYKFISGESKYTIFYDADDIMHSDMLKVLTREMERESGVGAVYCDHKFMDENGSVKKEGAKMFRVVPTRFWVEKLPDEELITPFISIFCWTKMIEPMTLLRRTAYEQTDGWDIDFGKGQGNIGEGVYLFSEIALNWEVRYINTPFYYYRRHSQQMSAISSKQMKEQERKVINKWEEKIKNGFQERDKIKLAILFFNYRLSAYRRSGSLKHQVRYSPLSAIGSLFLLIFEYIYSLPLIIHYKKLIY